MALPDTLITTVGGALFATVGCWSAVRLRGVGLGLRADTSSAGTTMPFAAT